MSGGSYDYIYSSIQDIKLRNTDTDPRRAAMQKILKLVAKAMHDIEWVDSSDYGCGDDHKAIDDLLSAIGSDPEVVKKALAYDAIKEQMKQFFDV
jgi:hypothetical protein